LVSAPWRKKYSPERPAVRTPQRGYRDPSFLKTGPSWAQGFGSYGGSNILVHLCTWPPSGIFPNQKNIFVRQPPMANTSLRSFRKICAKRREIFGGRKFFSDGLMSPCVKQLTRSRDPVHSSTLSVFGVAWCVVERSQR